jgi:CheY-like chemotaxis protein
MPLSASEGLCVMVADDEAPARQRIIDLLRRDSQVAAIIEASDGLSAVEIIQNRSPDLVFLDVQMPELNGLEVIAEVGADWSKHWPDVGSEGSSHLIVSFSSVGLPLILVAPSACAPASRSQMVS